MRMICVDDERLLMEDAVALCREISIVKDAKGFTKPAEALNWLEHEQADVALLDIDMPGMSGIELAKKIQNKQPQIAVIFLTGYSQYALDAYDVHPTAYLLKPVKKEKLAKELVYIASRTGQKSATGIEAHTFGNFDLLVEGKPVIFRQAKCKELLAYLIDRRGASVTRREAFAILWEDRTYDRPMQKQLDNIIRMLRTSLTECGAAEIFELQSATMRVNPELISCDAWRYLAGEQEAIRAFRGEYMSNYSWAALNEGAFNGYLSDKL